MSTLIRPDLIYSVCSGGGNGGGIGPDANSVLLFTRGSVTDVIRLGVGDYRIISNPGIQAGEVMPLYTPGGQNLHTLVEHTFVETDLRIRVYDADQAPIVPVDRPFNLLLLRLVTLDP